MGDRAKDQVVTDWEQKVLIKFGSGFELISVSGTGKNGERKIEVKCLTCGTIKAVSSISFRGEYGKHGHCDKCQMVQTEKRHQVAEQIRQTEKDRRKIKKRLKTKQVGFRFCECGAILAYHCSLCDDCREKRKQERIRNNYNPEKSRHADIKRDKLLSKVKRDLDCTNRTLYEKHKGICYLCGELCDWNDCRWEHGVFKVGKRYPTKEHILALNNGGDDTWENSRLAHLSCNSKKGTKVFESISPLG